LKIFGIARTAQALAPRVALSFQFKLIGFLSEPEANIFNLAMAYIMRKHGVI
jgi:hypothetical protein